MSSPEPAPAASIGSAIVGALQGFANASADAVVQAVGLWSAARTAIQTIASGITAAAVEQTVNEARAKYLATPLSPAVLADMVVRNLLTTQQAENEAALSGVDPGRFGLMTLDTGESYGIDQALRLYNRGLTMTALEPSPQFETGVPVYQAGASLATTYGITEKELETVIHYSRVRDQFIPDLLKLAKNTLSPADAVEMAVKQILSVDDAAKLFEAAGGVVEQFQALVDAAGDAAGVEKSVDMAAHGLIDQGQLDQIIGMSRLNPRFYYLAHPDHSGIAPLHRKWLAPYEIELAVKGGTVTPEVATEWLAAQGYDAEQASAFTTGLTAGVLSKPKEETAAMVLAEYEAGMLPATSTDPAKPGATEILEGLGYVPASIPWLLETAMWKRVVASRNAAVTRVRASYLLWDIDDAQASSDLTKLGVPAQTIPDLLTAWAVERDTPHLHLSAAQVGKLLKDGNIPTDVALQKWTAMGYTPSDAHWLLDIYPPPPPPVHLSPVISAPVPDTVKGGDEVEITVSGFAPGGAFTVLVGGLPATIVGNNLADATGGATLHFEVPDLVAGAASVDVNDDAGGSGSSPTELEIT